jgi:hypothetical protein
MRHAVRGLFPDRRFLHLAREKRHLAQIPGMKLSFCHNRFHQETIMNRRKEDEQIFT